MSAVGHESASAGATAAAAAAAAEPMRATLRLEVEVCASSPVAAHLTTCCLERDTAGAVQFALRWVFDTRLEAEMGGNTVSAVRVENRIESSDGFRRGVGTGSTTGTRGARTGWERRRVRR